MKTILDLHNIYYSYHTSHGETRALSNLSFSLAPGEFAAVVGPSGCGKSTLLSLICGLMKPQTGEILLNGEPVLGNSPHSRESSGLVLSCFRWMRHWCFPH